MYCILPFPIHLPISECSRYICMQLTTDRKRCEMQFDSISLRMGCAAQLLVCSAVLMHKDPDRQKFYPLPACSPGFSTNGGKKYICIKEVLLRNMTHSTYYPTKEVSHFRSAISCPDLSFDLLSLQTSVTVLSRNITSDLSCFMQLK